MQYLGKFLSHLQGGQITVVTFGGAVNHKCCDWCHWKRYHGQSHGVFPSSIHRKAVQPAFMKPQEVCLLSSCWIFWRVSHVGVGDGLCRLRRRAFPLKKWSSCMQGISDSCWGVGSAIFCFSFGNSLGCFLKKRVSVSTNLVGITDLIWFGHV